MVHTILIVCGAGASSTFVAHRLRGVAKARGLGYSITAASLDELQSDIRFADVVLLADHLGASAVERATRWSRETPVPRPVRIAALPAQAFGAAGAETTIDLIEQLLLGDPGSVPADLTPTTAETGSVMAADPTDRRRNVHG